MKLSIALALMICSITVGASDPAATRSGMEGPAKARRLGGKKNSKGGKGGKSGKSGKKMKMKKVDLTVTNLSYLQPFSGFFLMVHSSDAEPIYRMGEMPTEELARLAEDGNPQPLIDMYRGMDGVLSADVMANMASGGPGPLFGGETTTFTVEYNDDYNRITIATMAINTNDCFVAVNGAVVESGAVFNQPGLDAGSEVNNELCSSIPGPACTTASGNEQSGGGEGFVHVHRGFHGINDADPGSSDGQPLSAASYDWRNPMMRVALN